MQRARAVPRRWAAYCPEKTTRRLELGGDRLREIGDVRGDGLVTVDPFRIEAGKLHERLAPGGPTSPRGDEFPGSIILGRGRSGVSALRGMKVDIIVVIIKMIFK